MEVNGLNSSSMCPALEEEWIQEISGPHISELFLVGVSVVLSIGELAIANREGIKKFFGFKTEEQEYKNYLPELLERTGIKKKVGLVVSKSITMGSCACAINNGYRISMNPGLVSRDRLGAIGVLLHELGHVNYEKHFSQYPETSAEGRKKSIAHEQEADNFAIQHCTDDELLGFRRQFRVSQLSTAKNPLDKKDGDNELDLTHPPLSERIAATEVEIKRRGIVVDMKAEEALALSVMKKEKKMYIRHLKLVDSRLLILFTSIVLASIVILPHANDEYPSFRNYVLQITGVFIIGSAFARFMNLLNQS